MASLTTTATVARNGALVLSKAVRDALRLKPGDAVEVQVSVPAPAAPESDACPLLGIVGLGRSGRRDGSVNHDADLYGRTGAPRIR